jgi:hypothetical protein
MSGLIIIATEKILKNILFLKLRRFKAVLSAENNYYGQPELIITKSRHGYRKFDCVENTTELVNIFD